MFFYGILTQKYLVVSNKYRTFVLEINNKKKKNTIMSQCYSTFLAARIKDEQGLIKALQVKIADAKQDKVNYNASKEDTNTLEGLLDILFAAHQHNKDSNFADGVVTYSSCFNASYGWEEIMWGWFGVMAKFVVEGSYLSIDTDDGRHYLTAINGEVEHTGQLHKGALSLL